MMNVDPKKWEELSEALAEDEKSPHARFEHVYLIDDFTASGTTFIRRVKGEWKGKLKKFNALVRDARVAADAAGKIFPIAANYAVHIHHHVSTTQAKAALTKRIKIADSEWQERDYSEIDISEGMLLPPTLRMRANLDAAMLALCDKYYDHELYLRLKKHCDEAGQDDMRRGYADCALPLVLEHNTPNNSIPLLWAETDGQDGQHAMRPLFRRRDRHG
jgi:hypothetical protein